MKKNVFHVVGLRVCDLILLRLCGVYYPFFNQGGWDIDRTTRVYALDRAFAPATLIEADIQTRLRWLREPTGG